MPPLLMSFVLDPSVAVAWAFADEAHPVTAEALALIRSNVGRVPRLWWFEVRNVLIRQRAPRPAGRNRYRPVSAPSGAFADRRRWHARGDRGADLGTPPRPYCLQRVSSWPSAPPRRLPPST